MSIEYVKGCENFIRNTYLLGFHHIFLLPYIDNIFWLIFSSFEEPTKLKLKSTVSKDQTKTFLAAAVYTVNKKRVIFLRKYYSLIWCRRCLLLANIGNYQGHRCCRSRISWVLYCTGSCPHEKSYEHITYLYLYIHLHVSRADEVIRFTALDQNIFPFHPV